MTNADDTTPSESGEGNPDRSDAEDHSGDHSAEAARPSDSSDDAPEAPSDHAESDEIREITTDDIEFAGEEPSDGDASDASGPSETMLGGFEAQQLRSDEATREGESETAAPPDESASDEVLDVEEHDDLIIEEGAVEGGGQIEEGAFDRAREEDDDSIVVGESAPDYDTGPTVVSEDVLEPESDEASPRERGGGESDRSGATGAVSRERGGAGAPDVSEDDFGSSTTERQGSSAGAGEDRLAGVVDEMVEEEEHGGLNDSNVADDGTVEEDVGPGDGEFDEALHGETSLEADEEVLAEDAFEHEEYEETLISEQGLDIEEAPMPEAPAAGEATLAGEDKASPDQIAALHEQGADRGDGEFPRDEAGSDRGAESGEVQSPKTDLFGGRKVVESSARRLEIREGPGAGRELLVDSPHSVVGRSSETDLVIPDDALSRRHFEVVRQPDGSTTLRDLESANGTLVNGTPIQESPLSDGDRIEAGNTTLEYIESDGARNQSAQGRGDAEADHDRTPTGRPNRTNRSTRGRWRHWLNRAILAAVALMLPLAAIFIYLLAAGPSPLTEAELRDRNAAREAYLAGVEAERSNDWDRAAQQFERARSLRPELPGVERRSERIEMERRAAENLEKARAAAAEGRTARALELAESIPDKSSSSRAAAQLVRRVRREQRLTSLLQKARRRLDGGSPDEALGAVEEILEVAPNHHLALTLRAEILRASDTEVATGEEATPADKEPGRKTDDRTDVSGKRATADSKRDENSDSSWLLDSEGDKGGSSAGSEASGGGSGDIDFQRGYALYNQGRLEAAIAHFDEAAGDSGGTVSTRARRLARKIRAFQKVYRAAERNLESGNWARAEKKFREALNADKAVASAQYFKSKIYSRIAKAAARRGMQRVRDGAYAEAFEFYENARKYDSTHSDVRSLLRKLEKKADALYIQAKTTRKTDPEKAAALCRSIASMVPKKNKYHEKAQRLLDEL